jgi:putative two-component system response regulator
MKTIFVVDDNDTNLIKAKRALEGQYRIRTMSSAETMLTLIGKIVPDLILLDIEMPEMDGFSAINKLKANEKTAHIPVVILTAYENDAVEALGLKLGAVDFIIKPFSEPVLLNRIAYHLHTEELLRKRAAQVDCVQDGILEVVANMVESRDKTMREHIKRTSKYIEILLKAMQEKGVYTEEIQNWNPGTVICAARLHDVGNIAVSDVIFNKPAKLTKDEYEIVKSHAMEGERIIEKIIAKTGENPYLRHAKLIAGCHHEKWDGTGYPRGLKGDKIPLEGRIMALADVYDALISKRAYRKPYTQEDAERIIWKETRKHFDPAIVTVFAGVTEKFADYGVRGGD